MIKVKTFANKVTIEGHAGYSNSEDIVCASVSTCMFTTINAIARFNKDNIKFSDDSVVVTIEYNSQDDITDKLIINMLSILNELATKYPKNIKIESEE